MNFETNLASNPDVHDSDLASSDSLKASSPSSFASDCCVKLRVNDIDGVRRIPIYRLHSSSTESEDTSSIRRLDYGKLRDCAIRYSSIENPPSSEQFDSHTVEMRYLDDEGDSVLFSTDLELTEAIYWKTSKWKDTDAASIDPKESSPGDVEATRWRTGDGVFLRVWATVKLRSPFEFSSGDATPPIVLIKQVLDAVVSSVSKSVETLRTDLRDENRNNRFMRKPSSTAEFDASFIHHRHGCDCCGTSPIVGYRYHAVGIPNFDVCQECIDKVELPSVEFQLAQFGPDRLFAYPGKRRPVFDFWKSSVHGRRTGEECVPAHDPGDVEEGIARSLQDLKSRKDKLNNNTAAPLCGEDELSTTKAVSDNVADIGTHQSSGVDAVMEKSNLEESTTVMVQPASDCSEGYKTTDDTKQLHNDVKDSFIFPDLQEGNSLLMSNSPKEDINQDVNSTESLEIDDDEIISSSSSSSSSLVVDAEFMDAYIDNTGVSNDYDILSKEGKEKLKEELPVKNASPLCTEKGLPVKNDSSKANLTTTTDSDDDWDDVSDMLLDRH